MIPTRTPPRLVPTTAGLLRETDEALTKLRSRRITDHRIHQARRALKRARAVLRLLRPALGEPGYHLENTALRDAGRQLSPLRDAKATLDAFDALCARYADRLHGPALGPFRRVLEQALVGMRRAVRRPSPRLDECVGLLEAHQERMGRIAREAGAADTALEGVGQLYRKGRKALAEVEKATTTRSLHEWRKQVKYLHNAVDGIRGGLGPRADKLLARTDQIADLLGDDHDLSVLAAIVTGDWPADLQRSAADALCAVIDHRRRRLQRRSIKLGRRLYERKPRRFLGWLLKGAPAPGG